MKKILFVTNYPSPYRVQFFSYLGSDRNIDLDVAFMENANEQKHRDSSWFIKDYENFSPIFLKKRIKIKRGLFVCLEIFSLLKKDYDEIIFGGYSYLTIMLGMVWMMIHRKEYSLEIDGGFISKDSFIKKNIKSFFISHANKFYSTGKISDEYLVYYGANKDKIHFYPFSSIEKEYVLTKPLTSQEKATIRKKINATEDVILLFVGQFINRKGIDILMKAANIMPSNYGIYIVGANAPSEYISYKEKHDLHNLHFCGFKSKQELKDYYCAADILVFPTRYDIWGLVVNEALSNALPVITTDKCIAGLEMIEQGETGIIVQNENYVEIADAVNEILSWNLYKTGEKALNTAKKYTIDTMAQRHVEIILGA